MFHDVVTHRCFRLNTFQVGLHLRRIHKIAFASAQTKVIRIVALTLFLQAVVTVTAKLARMNVSVIQLRLPTGRQREAITYDNCDGVSFQLLGMLKPGQGQTKHGTVAVGRRLGKVRPWWRPARLSPLRCCQRRPAMLNSR